MIIIMLAYQNSLWMSTFLTIIITVGLSLSARGYNDLWPTRFLGHSLIQQISISDDDNNGTHHIVIEQLICIFLVSDAGLPGIKDQINNVLIETTCKMSLTLVVLHVQMYIFPKIIRIILFNLEQSRTAEENCINEIVNTPNSLEIMIFVLNEVSEKFMDQTCIWKGKWHVSNSHFSLESEKTLWKNNQNMEASGR